VSEPFRTWQCRTCGYIYDEAAGELEEGIAAGTRWRDIPADYTSTLCGTPKASFDMVEI
jgi:rubredoxin